MMIRQNVSTERSAYENNFHILEAVQKLMLAAWKKNSPVISVVL